MGWAIDDLVGWIAVGGTELGLALSDADEKEKAAVRTGLAIGLACAGNSAAVGAAVTAAASIADCVMEECEVDADIRQAVSVGSSAVGTVCSAGASSASLVTASAQVGLYAAGEIMEEAGVEGPTGTIMQSLASGVSMNAGEAIAKNVGGLAGAGAAAAVHEGTGGDSDDLLATMATGYSTGAAVGGAVGGVAQGASGSAAVDAAKPPADGAKVDPKVQAKADEAIQSLAQDKANAAGLGDADLTVEQHEAVIRRDIAAGKDPFAAKQMAGVQALVGEAVGAAGAAAVHARSEENSDGKASFLDSFQAGRAAGKAGVATAFAAVDGDGMNIAASATDLAGATAGVVKQTEVEAKADKARAFAQVHGDVYASNKADELGDKAASLGDFASATGLANEVLVDTRDAKIARETEAWIDAQRDSAA